MSQSKPPDLSIVIPARNEAENLRFLLPQINAIMKTLQLAPEIIVIDELADDQTRAVAAEHGATLLTPTSRGYGSALLAGLKAAQGDPIITMDADQSHPPEFLVDLWNARSQADILIASRYVPGGLADMPKARLALSRILNTFFSLGLGMKVKDMSSGYRLYARDALALDGTFSADFNVLQELLVMAAMRGSTIKEIPFAYHPRRYGSSHARVFRFGLSYLKTFYRLLRLRRKKAL